MVKSRGNFGWPVTLERRGDKLPNMEVRKGGALRWPLEHLKLKDKLGRGFTGKGLNMGRGWGRGKECGGGGKKRRRKVKGFPETLREQSLESCRAKEAGKAPEDC